MTAPGTGSVGYGYDARGRRTQITYPDTTAIDYTYYADGHLAGVWQSATQLVGYTYTPRGQPDQVIRALTTPITTTYAYDHAGRLTELATTTITDTLNTFSYVTDRRGCVQQLMRLGSPAIVLAWAREPACSASIIAMPASARWHSPARIA